MLQSLITHREVLVQLIRRDLEQRYRGSILGIVWTFLMPISMLLIYTFVFGIVFKQKWSGLPAQGPGEFALALFSGLLVYNFFSECVARAPSLVVQNPNYVKKVVFPIQWLPLVAVGAALVQLLISVLILCAALIVLRGGVPWTVVFFPALLLPLTLLVLGCVWLLSALGVFLRDISQIVSVAVSALLFLSPVFFPLSATPIQVQWLLRLNPLSLPIEHARGVLVMGVAPPIAEWLIQLALAVIWSWLGYQVFKRLRPHFADVL